MTTKWAHLPNAAHIDAVIASVRVNPAVTMESRSVAWDAAWDAAWAQAVVARDAALDAAWDAAWGVSCGGWEGAARDAILALIAYDDCAHMLDSDPDELRVLSRLGVDAATLMIPAAVALKLIREKQGIVL